MEKIRYKYIWSLIASITLFFVLVLSFKNISEIIPSHGQGALAGAAHLIYFGLIIISTITVITSCWLSLSKSSLAKVFSCLLLIPGTLIILANCIELYSSYGFNYYGLIGIIPYLIVSIYVISNVVLIKTILSTKSKNNTDDELDYLVNTKLD